jgi:hypothetical protein
MGKASATNNGLRDLTVTEAASWAHNRAVMDRVRGLTNDDFHWTVKLSDADRAEALRQARREVGLEVCTWERRLVGYVDADGNDCSWMMHTAPTRLYTQRELNDPLNLDVQQVAAQPIEPVYEDIEVWRPVES